MAGLSADFQSFRSPFPYFDPTLQQIDQSAELIQSVRDNSALNLQNSGPFSTENLLASNQHLSQVPGNWSENIWGIFHYGSQNSNLIVQPIVTAKTQLHGSNKRKAMDLSETNSWNSSSLPISQDGVKRKTKSQGGKRAKNNKEKPKDVVHVRARRGQATDSHSLAERVRREKIKEKLRCLQDIVPGCYKTMGMASMLDEIINYVQSLQNQVEFLSMELTAASAYYDFNTEAYDRETLQREKANEARLMREGHGGLETNYFSAWPL